MIRDMREPGVEHGPHRPLGLVVMVLVIAALAKSVFFW